jgi:hypothetical protein
MNDTFSAHKFLIKITSRSFFAWAVSCALTAFFCFRNGDHAWLDYLVIGNIIITGLFIGGKVVVDSIAEFVKKGNLDVKLGVPK